MREECDRVEKLMNVCVCVCGCQGECTLDIHIYNVPPLPYIADVSFPHFPFNVFTSYLIILPHRKRQTFICIFLVNIYIHLSVGLNGVHSAMNLELCSLTQSLAHAPIFLPFVSMSDIIRLYILFAVHTFHVCILFTHHTLIRSYIFLDVLLSQCHCFYSM